MKDEDLIRTYLQQKTIKGTAQVMGVPNWTAGNRIRRLRKYGVNIPKYGYTEINREDIDRLNNLIKNYESTLRG